uniref:Uncharacterized protein n=1 Tax=Siphoviridae sp. ct33S22 TaxID=2826279 RepID=A0A8S5QKU0_9CAUD|nr:MAG TPA: hypothetical protein [Siphoviridae sp. ct33S22]
MPKCERASYREGRPLIGGVCPPLRWLVAPPSPSKSKEIIHPNGWAMHRRKGGHSDR